jgi:hypothetical protein
MARIEDMILGQDTQDLTYCLGILSQSHGGNWVVSLPPDLEVYQGELEALLGRVFSGHKASVPENFALAQQMSLNWCMSKCREVGISFEESLSKLTSPGAVAAGE